MNPSYKDINQEGATFLLSGITYDKTKKNGSDDAGKCVKLSADKTCALTGDTEEIFGVLRVVHPAPAGGSVYGTVDFQGFLEVPTTGAIVAGQGLQGSATAGVAKAKATELQSPLAISNTDTDKWIMLLR